MLQLKKKILDITKLQLYYTCTKAIAIMNPIFVANQEDKFIKLKEKD